MPDKYQREVKKQIKKIIADGSSEIGSKKTPLIEQYIAQFYRHTPLEFLQSIPAPYLYCAAVENWNFISSRNSKQSRKVRVFNPSLDKDGWVSPRTIVELSTNDSPFILDSISAELTQHGYRIYEVMHPILHLRRDKNGKIVELFEKEGSKETIESAMHFQISHIVDDKELKKLELDIENTLHFVNLTVEDWQPIIKKTHEIIEYLDGENIPYDRDYITEVQDFLQWNINRNFIFLGYRKYDFTNEKGKVKVCHDEAEDLGILRAKYDGKPQHEAKPLGIEALPECSIVDAVANTGLMEITKSARKSVVHRPVHMDYIGIKIFNKKGEVIGEHRMLGLFTSAVYYQSAMTIPIIRRKIDSMVRKSGFKPDSHSGKALVTVLESYPRDELLQITEDELFSTGMGIVELMERPTTRLFVRRDRFNRFVSCIIFIPRDRYNTSVRYKVQAVLQEQYGGVVTDYYTQVTESPLARVHMLIKIDAENVLKPKHAYVEKVLIEVTTSWANGLQESLIKNVGEREGEKLFLNYIDAFPESFKDYYHFGGTFCDIMSMEEALHKEDLTLDLYQHDDDDEGAYQLKIYHAQSQVTLSNILPILENMGFHAVDELTFFIAPKHYKKGIWVHHFRLKVSSAVLLRQSHYKLSQIKDEFEEAMFKIWHGEIEDDALNKLILRAGMKWRNVVMLRSYSKYILQTNFPYSYEYMVSAIARHPILTGLMIDLFSARFSSDIPEIDRQASIDGVLGAMNMGLAKVTNVAEDRIIRQFTDTIMATLRTNFYQLDEHGKQKSYISFKIDSQKVPNLPLPRPHVEIFVYSRDIEGVHLRGGKVARGGLRWSDRIEDFRTEVLGLVKAQMVKNSVIVPVGSKGGFVVKHPVTGSRDEVIAQGQECYKTYLSGLLDITDNIVDGKVVPPSGVVRHDDDDPYLVVAADKGTATFSDIANSVAQKYGFWLDDAFASGGSVGYDHKKMGITARGAWVSVQRHFMEMGIDCQKQDFTTIGIGDMAGDVFGNGMLLSKHTRLIGAFNHMHIFIDPNPDAPKSWKERKRLFDLPRSNWLDYDKKLISKGGAIFERSAKEIKLNKVIRELFDIEEQVITPDELIKHMLKARVDLLWNGGIGTYVKADDESSESVGDKANDSLRVNGKDLRCRIIGEGGNLGMTQKARIEYALKGGRINTDAIDNSAGVDCSDHEVNIKIALNKAVENGKISHLQRNNLLIRMTDEVADLVLQDNILQTQAITIAQLQGHMIIEQKARMMEAFEDSGFLDRKIEFLPDSDTLALRQSSQLGLSRPELSVILAYAKMDVYEDLICSNLPDDEYLKGEVIAYFPEEMQEKFPVEIADHQLRREIVTTRIANSIVNRAGSTFFYHMKEDTGLKGCDVARAYIVTRDAYNLRDIWHAIEALGAQVSAEMQTELFLETRGLIDRASSWFLRNSAHPLDASVLVADFAPGIKEISLYFDDIVSPILKDARDKRMKSYIDNNVPADLARRIADLEGLTAACNIVQVAKTSDMELKDIGKIYFAVGARLSFGWLRFSAQKLMSHSHWENLAVTTFIETFFDQQMRVTADVIKLSGKNVCEEESITSWCESNEKNLCRYDLFINDLKRQESIDQAMLTVAIQRGEALFSN